VRTIEKGAVVNVLEEGKEKMRKEGEGNWVSKGRLKGKGEMEGRKRERERKGEWHEGLKEVQGSQGKVRRVCRW